MKKNELMAFTLAEVLITLVIIGVIAAITVPMLINDTKNKQYVAGMQKAKATIGEAFRLMTINGEISSSVSTEDFVKTVIPKYLKLSKICGTGKEAAQNCGFASKIKQVNGNITELKDLPMKWSDSTNAKVVDEMPMDHQGVPFGNAVDYTTKYSDDFDESYFFQTLDGFSINFFYNPYCAANWLDKFSLWHTPYYQKQHRAMDIACLNAVYDMNGIQGPNEVGKDIGFVGSFFNGYEATVRAVLPSKEKDISELDIINSDYVDTSIKYCNELDGGDTWILADIDELTLIGLNYKLIEGVKYNTHYYWSRTHLPEGASRQYWEFHTTTETYSGLRSWTNSTNTINGSTNWVRCVRRTALK